ncbi:MAG: hypothetical protein KIS94_01300 [Chitinophagales bacterium]|nr:hypothetical protein [Chitinophagales bacterium]
MQREIAVLKQFRYSAKEWFWMKVLFVPLWLVWITMVLYKHHAQPFPEGICQYINCAFVATKPAIYIVLLTALASAVFYVAGRFMPVATFLLAVISIIVFSFERSNGIYHREELFSLIFTVQFIACLRWYFSSGEYKQEVPLRNVAVFYSVSVIAGAYVLAGIAKINGSGFAWITQSPYAALQTLQSFEHKSVDTGLEFLIPYGNFVAALMLKFPFAVQLLFAFALVVELGAFAACFSRKTAQRYGVLLLFLHLGMFLLLFVKLLVFIWSVALFMANIPGYFLSKQNLQNENP